jgi:hypothetical protein
LKGSVRKERIDNITWEEDINVEDVDKVEEERERKTNLSYGKRKMVIKHDEEMAQNKIKVDKLLWGKKEDGLLKERTSASHTIGVRMQAAVELWRVETRGRSASWL